LSACVTLRVRTDAAALFVCDAVRTPTDTPPPTPPWQLRTLLVHPVCCRHATAMEVIPSSSWRGAQARAFVPRAASCKCSDDAATLDCEPVATTTALRAPVHAPPRPPNPRRPPAHPMVSLPTRVSRPLRPRVSGRWTVWLVGAQVGVRHVGGGGEMGRDGTHKCAGTPRAGGLPPPPTTRRMPVPLPLPRFRTGRGGRVARSGRISGGMRGGVGRREEDVDHLAVSSSLS